MYSVLHALHRQNSPKRNAATPRQPCRKICEGFAPRSAKFSRVERGRVANNAVPAGKGVPSPPSVFISSAASVKPCQGAGPVPCQLGKHPVRTSPRVGMPTLVGTPGGGGARSRRR